MLCLLLALLGCEQRPTKTARPVYYEILAVGTGPDDPVWHAVRTGLERYDRFDNSVDVRVVLPESDAPLAQKRLLDGLQSFDKPTCICVLTRKAKVLVQSMARLADFGVEVVLIGDDSPKSGRAAAFRPDHAAVGRAMGKTAAQVCGSRPTVMILHNNRLDLGSLLRFEGLTDQLKSHRDITVLRDFDAGPRPEQALQTLQTTSLRYKDLGVWVLVCDWFRPDVPLDKPLLHGSAKIVTMGAHGDNLRLIESGYVDALVGVDWEDLAFKAALTCRQILGSSAIPVMGHRAEPIVITADNADAYREKWGLTTTQPTTQTAKR